MKKVIAIKQQANGILLVTGKSKPRRKPTQRKPAKSKRDRLPFLLQLIYWVARVGWGLFWVAAFGVIFYVILEGLR